MGSRTVKQHLEENNGIAPGYDALRLLLAASILLWHTVYICYGKTSYAYITLGTHPVSASVLRSLLPMFFFLSGFLVTGSACRVRKVGKFLKLRALRIVPALFVEVTLCAIVLGSFLTTLPLKEYYSDPRFFLYFGNIVGWVHYYLPGVFTHNIVNTKPVVNANLWTLPSEFECYFLMAGLMVSGIIFNRKAFGWFFLLFSLVFLILLPLTMNWGLNSKVYIQPKLLVYAFLIGAACYVFADRIRISRALVLLALPALFFFSWKYTIILGVFAACYLTLCFGFLKLGNIGFLKSGDYSYGVYLYGYPIERTLFYYLHEWISEWWQLFLVALPATLLFAMISWHVIERPCLKLGRRLKEETSRS